MIINQMEKDHRSSTSVFDTDEFDDEEAKMEKFYELIRSFNEARANHQRNLQQSLRQNRDYQVINHLNNNDSNNNHQKNDVNNRSTKSSLDNLLPSFKWEDFRGVLRQNHDDQDQNQNGVVVSDKSGNDFLKNTMNCSEFDNNNNNNNNDNNVINKLSKKRKIDDVKVVDDDGDYRDEEVNADKVKISRPQIKLDLNLAL